MRYWPKGEIRAIATPGTVRGPTLQNVPTSSEQGFTDDAFQVLGFQVLAAPAGTPKEIVRKVSDLWVQAADSEPGRKMMDAAALNQKPMPHEQAVAAYEEVKARVIPLVMGLGITPE